MLSSATFQNESRLSIWLRKAARRRASPMAGSSGSLWQRPTAELLPRQVKRVEVEPVDDEKNHGVLVLAHERVDVEIGEAANSASTKSTVRTMRHFICMNTVAAGHDRRTEEKQAGCP